MNTTSTSRTGLKAALLAGLTTGALLLSACGSTPADHAADRHQPSTAAGAGPASGAAAEPQAFLDGETGEWESAPVVTGEYEPAPVVAGEYEPAPDETGEWESAPDQTGEYQPLPDQTGQDESTSGSGSIAWEEVEPVPAASAAESDADQSVVVEEIPEQEAPTLTGISGPEDLIPALPCDGTGVVGTVVATDFDDAVSRLGELEQQYPGARFGRFSEPCGPDGYVLAYWDEPTTDLDTLAQTRRSLRQPLVNVYPMDSKSQGYLVTGACSLIASGEQQPRLEQGVALSAEENGWLYELTDHLANQGLLDHRAVTTTWIDNSIDDAIREYQASMGLEADGVAGPDTWSALAGELCVGGRSISHPLDH